MAAGISDGNQCRNTILVTEKLVSSTMALGQAAKLSLQPANIDSARAALRDLRLAVALSKDPTCESLFTSARSILDGITKVVEACASVNANPRDGAMQYKLASATQALPATVQAVLHSAGGLTVGVKQCDEAITELEAALTEIDSAAVAAAFNQLETKEGSTHFDSREELSDLIRELAPCLRRLADSNPQEKGFAAESIKKAAPKLVAIVKAAASTTTTKATQQAFLNSAKGLSDAVLSLLGSVRQSMVGSSEAADEVAFKLAEAEKALASLGTSAVTGAAVRELETALDTIEHTSRDLNRAGGSFREAKSYKHCKTEVKLHCQELVKCKNSFRLTCAYHQFNAISPILSGKWCLTWSPVPG